MAMLVQKLFVLALFACLCQTSINASPARRVFDISAADLNNINGVGQVQSVDSTIKEVESLLRADPSLPRLTRGEILDIIENLTRSDVHNVRGQSGIIRDPKAIMVVMPYSGDSAQNGDVESLYTKPPITQIIGDSDDENKEFISKKKRLTKKPYRPIEQNYLDYTSAVKFAKIPDTTTENNYFTEEYQQQQSTIEVVTQKPRTTTENPITKFINQRRRKTTKIPSNHKLETQSVQRFTTTTTTTTTQAPRTTRRRKATRRPSPAPTTTSATMAFVPNSGINIIDPPSFNTNAGNLHPAVIAFQPFPTRSHTTTTTTTTTAPMMIVDEVQIPEDFKEVLKSLDILIKQSPTEPPLQTMPTTMTSIDQLSEQDKLKLLLASLNAQAQTTTTTTTTQEPDVVQVANNLTPEMKELLMTFGLIPDPNKDKTTTPKEEIFMEPSSVVSADSYANFKPLPASSNLTPTEEMEDFLSKFGLVDKNKNNREQKAISISKPGNEVISDVIPEESKGVMADIDLTKSSSLPEEHERTPIQSDSHQLELELPKKIDHVFNPAVSGTEYATQDEINRLNQLMAVIKQFEKLNNTANEDDLKHIDLEGLKDLVNSFNVPLDEQNGPNPIDYDVGLIRNEVKRQTSTTEKSAAPLNPSLALLEDSFGGFSDTVAESLPTTTTEAPKKTGFYYLVDWNSFLDIDNQKGKRVNLRFQPTIGDPKRFLSVTVP